KAQAVQSGCSTIPMELAKVAYLYQPGKVGEDPWTKTICNLTGSNAACEEKVYEAAIALRLNQPRVGETRDQMKARLLTDYFNRVYYGKGATGIAAASEAYFGIPASQDNFLQAATLAGMLPNPSPRGTAAQIAQAITARRNHVLQQEAKYGYLPGPTPAEL